MASLIPEVFPEGPKDYCVDSGSDTTPSAPNPGRRPQFEGKLLHTLDGGDTWTEEGIKGLCVCIVLLP